MRRCLVHITLFLACVMGAAGAEPPSLEAALSPVDTPYHRSVVYAVTVEASPETQVTFPTLSPENEQIEVRKGEQSSIPLEEGRLRRTQYYRVDAIAPGMYSLPPFSVSWQEGDTTGTLTAPPVAFNARELTQAETEAAAGFAGLTAPDALLPEKGFSWTAMAAGIAVAVAAGTALAAVLYYRRRRTVRAAPPLPAWETALNRLRELAQRDLPGAGKLEMFYVDLSSILRYYIEDRFHIQAPEQTTPEFLEAAAERRVFSESQQEFLTRFLRQCDRIKFARMEPGVEEAKAHFKEVRLFVKETVPGDAEKTSLEPAA